MHTSWPWIKEGIFHFTCLFTLVFFHLFSLYTLSRTNLRMLQPLNPPYYLKSDRCETDVWILVMFWTHGPCSCLYFLLGCDCKLKFVVNCGVLYVSLQLFESIHLACHAHKNINIWQNYNFVSSQTKYAHKTLHCNRCLNFEFSILFILWMLPY